MYENLVKFVRETFETSNFIPLHQPVFDVEDKSAVISTIRDSHVSTVGPKVTEFENTKKNQVMTRPSWTPMHKLQIYKNCQKSDMSNTNWVYERIVNMPNSSLI